MLKISPKKDNSIIEKYNNDKAVVLMCDDDGVEKGYIAFYQYGYIIDILDFEVYYREKELKGESYIIADTLIKSLCSYALNHSCFYLESSNSEIFDLLKNFAFAQSDNKLKSNLQQLFKVCVN